MIGTFHITPFSPWAHFHYDMATRGKVMIEASPNLQELEAANLVVAGQTMCPW